MNRAKANASRSGNQETAATIPRHRLDRLVPKRDRLVRSEPDDRLNTLVRGDFADPEMPETDMDRPIAGSVRLRHDVTVPQMRHGAKTSVC